MKLNQVLKLPKLLIRKKIQRYKKLKCQRIFMKTKFKFQAFLVTYQKIGKSGSTELGTFKIQAKGFFFILF